jgi:hypothetical protein
VAISLAEVPNRPGIYALYGGNENEAAYVGQAGKLRERLTQHLIRRDSSVTTGASVASLNPDLVRLVTWWTDERFDGPAVLDAAELVAFKILNPVLRSRGRPKSRGVMLAGESGFEQEFTQLFSGPPSGRLSIDTTAELVERLRSLETRVEALERHLGEKGQRRPSSS